MRSPIRFVVQPRYLRPVGGGLDVVAAADAASGVDSALVQVVGSDRVGGTDVGALAAAVPDAELSTGVDIAVLAAEANTTDAAATTDAGVLAVLVSVAESALGTDDAMLAVVVPAVDGVVGTDSAALAAALASDERAVGVEDVQVSVIPALEDAVGADSALVSAVPSVVDAGAGTDVGVVDATTTHFDSAAAVDGALLGAMVISADVVGVVDVGMVVTAVTVTESATAAEFSGLGITNSVVAAETSSSVDVGSVAVAATAVDQTDGRDRADLVVHTADSGIVSSDESVTLVGLADVASGTDGQSVLVIQQVSTFDTADSVEGASVLQEIPSLDTADGVEDAELSPVAADVASSVDSEDLFVTRQILANDVALGLDTASPALAPPPRSVFDIESSSVVEILRSVTTRIHGSARVRWLPLAQLVSGELFALSPGHIAGSAVLGGQLVVRFDLHFVRPGAALPAPPVSGFTPDRAGVLFADVAAAGVLKAGDRVRCLSGPIDGIFEIRVIPDIAVGYSTGHHLEVEVVEVAQRPGGSYIAPMPDLTGTASFMRPLYDTRVEVLRSAVVAEGPGSARTSWPVVTDVLDTVWGVPGEMWCRLSLRFLRRGKDQPPPVMAGRAPDRIGVLYSDTTPHLLAGDRVRCVQGPVTGTFELRVAPDLSPDLFAVHHLEVQVVEVAQALAGVFPRAGGG